MHVHASKTQYISRSYNKSLSILCFYLMEGVLLHVNAEKRKKMLKNFKFHNFIGRFQVKPWQ